MRVLGISAYYHDSAAALVVDGKIAAAAQEERFSRRKHDAGFPRHAVEACLRHAKLRLRDLDYVAFYDKPFLKFERLLETYLALAPRGLRSFTKAMPLWIREKLFQKSLLCRELAAIDGECDQSLDFESRVLFTEHHQSHAASAFFPSPFQEAAILTMDGTGEWATTSAALGTGSRIEIIREIHFPHSLGLLYSAFTYHAGFRVNSGEYKLMGLAPYGKPKYRGAILDNLIDVKSDGSFRLNLDFFDYCTGLTMTNSRFDELFGARPRRPEEPLGERHMDMAASIQAVLEEIVLRLARSLARETGRRNLCLAGGVALNCVANSKILRDGCFDGLWIQPAAGDAGGALGAALAGYHLYAQQPRDATSPDAMQGAFLGPEYSQDEIERRLRAAGARFETLDEDALLDACAAAIDRGEALGWFQGRMEFGPRALGARSILADARSSIMQEKLNAQVKRRESFRPFAPSVLREDAPSWFDLACDSPYMLLTASVAVPRSEIPAVTHVDLSARVQTVHRETSPRFYRLIERFKQRTGCPVIVNTSFNVRGEPIVESPEDAFRCFLSTDIEVLAIGNCFLRRAEQAPALWPSAAQEFDDD